MVSISIAACTNPRVVTIAKIRLSKFHWPYECIKEVKTSTFSIPYVCLHEDVEPFLSQDEVEVNNVNASFPSALRRNS